MVAVESNVVLYPSPFARLEKQEDVSRVGLCGQQEGRRPFSPETRKHLRGGSVTSSEMSETLVNKAVTVTVGLAEESVGIIGGT